MSARLVVAGLVVFLWAGPALGLRVPERVEVRSEALTLADLVPDAPASWARVRLGPAPRPGRQRVLSGAWVRQRAGTVGAADELELPDRIVVERPGREIGREELVRAVLGALAARLGGDEEVRVLGVGLPAPVPEGEVELVPRLPRGPLPSPATLWVDVRVDGEREARGWVRAEIVRARPVVVLARDVRRGEVLSADDLEVRPAAGGGRRGLADPRLVLGKRLRRTLRAGAVLTERDVETVPVVERGDLVRLVARVGAVTATTLGRAVEAAGIGERVRVENLSSGRTVAGVVREAGVVDVTAGAEGR